MVLPPNINPGKPDPLPTGIFLIPLCTDQEGATEMLYALDTAYKMSGKISVIKDYLNALQYISNPEDAICMTSEPPEEPIITIETDGDCTRVLVNGSPVTDWICARDTDNPPIEPTVGTLGFTLSELESIAMGCLNLDGSIKWVNGVLYIRTCDGWLPVPGGAGAVVQSGSGNAGQQSFDEWVDSGSPEIAPTDPIPHVSEFYTTLDSLKCAKATAMVNEIWNVLTIGDAVEDAENIIQIGSAISGALSAAAWPIAVVYNLGYGLASTIWTIATGEGFAEYADNMTDIHANMTVKNDLICDLVDRMVAPVQFGSWKMNTLTSADVTIAIERFKVIANAPDSVMKTLGAFSVQNWQEVVKDKVGSTDCGCEEYLPYGYTPNPLAGFHFAHDRFASMSVSYDTLNELNGTVLGTEDTFAVPAVGVLSGQLAKTAYAGQSASYPIDRFHWIITPSEAVSLDVVKMTVAYSGTPTQFSAEIHVFDSVTGLWENFASASDPAAPIDTLMVMGAAGTAHDITAISIQLKVRAVQSSNTRVQVTVSGVTFTGTIDGNAFIDLPINEEL